MAEIVPGAVFSQQTLSVAAPNQLASSFFGIPALPPLREEDKINAVGPALEKIQQIHAEFPEKLQPLFIPMRYKVPFGGRGAGKSWSIARALLLMGKSVPLRIVCGREIMDSIAGSVHTLLSDQIHALGLDAFYEIGKAEIIGLNGTKFSFVGLRHNINKIRSLEGVDIFWVEEAQTVSGLSWDVLIPTIRKAGSEIWISFNPELETDETYKRFVLSPPTDAWVCKIGWRDNPWFSDMMNGERLTKRRQDPDGYMTVWEGNTRRTLQGAVYANELREARLQGRITRVPYDRSKPVYTFWDLGRRDMTSIWFAQIVGFQFRIIDFYQNNLKHIDHYLQLLQSKEYTYLTHWIPKDGASEQLGQKLTIEAQMKAKGFTTKIVKEESIFNGITAVRTIFPNCWIDEVNCAEGIQCLERYQYEVDEVTKLFSDKPLHNFWSHGADAFRYLALGLQEKEKAPKKVLKTIVPPTGAQGWMGR